MVRLAHRASPLGLALLSVLVLQGSALAATKDVSISGSAFDPSTVKAKLGDSVRWTNNDGFLHTSTSDGIDGCCPNGPSLWKSGNIPGGGGTFTFTFTAAGAYGYHCSIHNFMNGTVSVGMKVNPSTGSTTTQFKVTWATAIPSGFNVDIQISRPGGPGFEIWKVNQRTKLKASFVPDAGPGTYKFRARLQNESTGGASKYSPAKSIEVTP
jgi:plastocyanin